MAKTTIELRLEGFADVVRVIELRGREALSQPYRFDLIVHLPGDTRPASIIGAGARLALDVDGANRLVAGWVQEARVGATLSNGLRSVKLRVVPRWSRLAERRNSRIFQDMTTVEIAMRVAAEHGVVVQGVTLEAQAKREVCIQHQETDLAFLERLFADEGLVYFFATPGPDDDREVVTVIDAASHYEVLEGRLPLELRTVDLGAALALNLEEHNVTSFERVDRSRSNAVDTREFDLNRPPAMLTSRAPAQGGERSWFEHHSEYGENQPVANPARILEQVERRTSRARGVSLCRRLAPGRIFDLEGDDGDVAGRWVVTRVIHRAADAAAERGEHVYENRFSVVSDDILYRPARRAPKIHQVLETATVVGPEAEVIHTDVLGRIKVQFHWDREGKYDDRSSCWLRVSQLWAGQGWGAQFIPRVGMEVIVGFLQGDIDRPMVLGCVENATHLAPFKLPRERTRSGIRTNSVGSEGFNELSFEDIGGQEQIRMRAQRDLAVQVLNDAVGSVGNDARLTIGANLRVRVEGSQDSAVMGDVRASYASSVTTQTLGDVVEAVERDRTLAVGASCKTEVAGSSSSKVGGDRVDTVDGGYTIRVGVRQLIRVGTPEHEGQLDLSSSGAIALQGERAVQIAAAESIQLTCGESSIKLESGRITIRSREIRLAAIESLVASGEGPMLELKKNARVLSEEIQLLGKSGSLEITTDDTSLKGKQVKLGDAAPKPGVQDATEKEETQKVELLLTDENFEPYANKVYVAIAQGAKVKGTSDGDGRVTLLLPKAAKQVHITIWTADYPTGPRREISIQLETLPDVDLIAGAQERLRNLGYYSGATNGIRLDGPTSDALRHFQHDHQLPETGQLDEPTQAALLERHGL